jgi:twitching motility protein PilT
VAAFEILTATPAVQNLIREGKTPQLRNALVTGQRYGMQTLEMDLSRLVRENVITREEAERRAIVPKEITVDATHPSASIRAGASLARV